MSCAGRVTHYAGQAWNWTLDRLGWSRYGRFLAAVKPEKIRELNNIAVAQKGRREALLTHLEGELTKASTAYVDHLRELALCQNDFTRRKLQIELRVKFNARRIATAEYFKQLQFHESQTMKMSNFRRFISDLEHAQDGAELMNAITNIGLNSNKLDRVLKKLDLLSQDYEEVAKSMTTVTGSMNRHDQKDTLAREDISTIGRDGDEEDELGSLDEAGYQSMLDDVKTASAIAHDRAKLEQELARISSNGYSTDTVQPARTNNNNNNIASAPSERERERRQQTVSLTVVDGDGLDE